MTSRARKRAPPTTLPPRFQQQAISCAGVGRPWDPVTQYTLPDGTLVTHVGWANPRPARSRARLGGDRRSLRPVRGSLFRAAVARSHDLRERVAHEPAARVITIVMRPQWNLYGTNFRQGYIGRRKR